MKADRPNWNRTLVRSKHGMSQCHCDHRAGHQRADVKVGSMHTALGDRAMFARFPIEERDGKAIEIAVGDEPWQRFDDIDAYAAFLDSLTS